MKILLVFPPMLGEERYGKLARAGSYLPPLGLAYLAAVLEKEHEVKIMDGSVLDITVEQLVDEVERWDPDVVGITVHTPTFHRAVAICELIKKKKLRAVTILGGPHPSACPQDCIGNECVDMVVVGEGEKTIVDLSRAIEVNGDLSEIRGIFYKKNGKVFSTSPQERIVNLDELTFPARHLLDMKLYKPSVMHYKNSPAFSIMCGRGCPYKCTFCSCSKVFRGRVTLRSPENVIKEVKHLIDKYGAREILVWDDTFGLSKKWTHEVCKMLKPLKITWSAWMRANIADKEILKEMSDSGCWHISYGVESGNQEVLDTIKKGITIEQVRNAFRWTHEAGMEARGTFILGLPKDTWKTMMDTINLAIEIEADYAQFQLLTPYPGTELWDTAEQYGDFSIKDLSKYTIWFPVFVPFGLTKEELQKAHKLAYRKFYFRPNYIWQRFSSIKNFNDINRYILGLRSLLDYFSKG